LPLKSGVYQHFESPKGLYEAKVRSYHKKCFWGNRKEHYMFSIMNTATGNIIHNIWMMPNKPRFDIRGEDNIITWSSNSSEVTFVFQEIEFKFRVKKDS
jgi:hypothetical protein